MTVEMLLTIVGTVIGIAGLIYALMTTREKAKLEKLIKAELRGLAGNIDWIKTNAGWAGSHFRDIQKHCLNLDRNEHVNKILEHAHLGGDDSMSAERMMQNLFNNVLILQQGMFGTRIVIHHGEYEKYDPSKGQRNASADS